MDELKRMIRALAISNASNGITVAQLNKDFKNLEGYAIPYSKFGFQSLDGMLRTMTDAVRVSGYGLTAVVEPLTNEKTQHVRQMVKMSKPVKKKHSLYNRSFQANFNNPFYDNTFSSHLDDNMEDGYNDEIAYTNAVYTHEKNNKTQQQHMPNGHLQEKLSESFKTQTYKSEKMSPNTNNRCEKKTVEITKPLVEEYKRTSRVTDTENTKTPAQNMNGSVLQMNNLTVPADAMTIKEKIAEDAHIAQMLSNATVKAVVTSVLNPRHIFVHLLKHTDTLHTLAPQMDSFYSAKMTEYEWLIPEEMVQVGLYCAAKYHDRWYRAQVMSQLNYQRALLLYIDYGYLRYVPLIEIRFLTRELASIPQQGIRVGLKYLKPSNNTWSKECCEQLASLVHGKVFQMHVVDANVKENMLNVILTDFANGSVDSFVHNTDVGNLNRQLAKRDDISWTAE